jgi:hypothetical protein
VGLFNPSSRNIRLTITLIISDAASKAALTSWDKEALQRWDMLHQEQQKKLQSWQVPCFFETRDPALLKKQQRVFDVLYGLLE